MMTQRAVLNLLKPLIKSGIYKDVNVALKDITVDYIERKIESYNAVIKKMERKYKKSFNAFGKEGKGRAKMDAEDDWMEWKAAILMKESWQKVLRSYKF
jgi:hypothetical protein